ncbi:MAG: cytochrome c3 family protein [Bradyrhizobium sp.]
MTVLIAVGAVAVIDSRPLHADDRPLLIEIHRTAGLKCAQCHREQPPKLVPPNTTCLGCHGDQQALASKTSAAMPNPHAPPHLAAGETQVCTECHHVHRRSEVSCSTCHREFEFDVK